MEAINIIFDWYIIIINTFSAVADFFTRKFRPSELYTFLPDFFNPIWRYIEGVIYKIPIIGDILEQVGKFSIVEMIIGPGLLFFIAYTVIIWVLNIVT